MVIARPDAEGYVCLYSLSTVDLVVDVSGVFPAGSPLYTPLDNPVRLLDTRVAGLSRS